MSDEIQVQTTTDDEAVAERIAKALVQRRLAACVQIVGPIKSFYRWNEETRADTEWLCLIKTTHDHYRAVEAAIVETHNYEMPEIIATTIVEGHPDYLAWLRRETGELQA